MENKIIDMNDVYLKLLELDDLVDEFRVIGGMLEMVESYLVDTSLSNAKGEGLAVYGINQLFSDKLSSLSLIENDLMKLTHP